MKARGKQCNPVFIAFPRSNRYCLLLEVEVQNSHVQAFAQPQPRCIDDTGHQVVGWCQPADQALNFPKCQNNRRSLRSSRRDCFRQSFDGYQQDVTVQEQKSIERPLLGGCRNPPLHCQVAQKMAQMCGSNFQSVNRLYSGKESPDPAEIGLFGSVRLVL